MEKPFYLDENKYEHAKISYDCSMYTRKIPLTLDSLKALQKQIEQQGMPERVKIKGSDSQRLRKKKIKKAIFLQALLNTHC